MDEHQPGGKDRSPGLTGRMDQLPLLDELKNLLLPAQGRGNTCSPCRLILACRLAFDRRSHSDGLLSGRAGVILDNEGGEKQGLAILDYKVSQGEPAGAVLPHHAVRRLLSAVFHELVVQVIEDQRYTSNPCESFLVASDAEAFSAPERLANQRPGR